jgi:hypothetical protein
VPGDRGARFEGLRAEPGAGPAGEVGVTNARRLEPVAPPRIVRIDEAQPQKIPRLFQRRRAVEQARAEQRRVVDAHQFVESQSGLAPRSVVDRNIDRVAGEVGQLDIGDHANRDMRRGQLESADASGQPMRREGRRGADRQGLFGGGFEVGQRLAEQAERFGRFRRQAGAGLRQLDLARPPQKQPGAKRLFQQLDLVADGRLRHAELFARPGETRQPRHGVKNPQRVQRQLARQLHA